MRVTLATSALVSLTLLASCTFSNSIRLRNKTNGDLVLYPVVTNPPPPHREASIINTIAKDDFGVLNHNAFNPVYYQAGIANPSRPNGLYLGFDLYDADPLVILYRVMHYVVPPGQEGNDPALQPIILEEDFVEVPDQNLVVRVIQENVMMVPPMPGGWRVEITARP